MCLTHFSHAALCVLGGMMLSLFIGHYGRDLYAGVIGLLVLLVLFAEWRTSRPQFTHEVRDDA